jgi:hypothetical protein
MRLGVVYLSWAGAGLESIERFVGSVEAYPAGLRHTLVVAWKGYPGDEPPEDARRLASQVEHEETVVSAAGLDLSAYREIALASSFDLMCFLNSSSEALADGWLSMMRDSLSAPDVGIVGASGSYESALSSAPRPLRILRRGRFPPFPNPHLRSNGFLIDRRLLLSLNWSRTTSKRAAWALESGVHGVTAQIRERGLGALVIGRDGHAYRPEAWPDSATFRSGEQENLLIADNRTRQYAMADPAQRGALRRMAWGDLAG